jgi:predicted amidohydrolase YtcJ
MSGFADPVRDQLLARDTDRKVLLRGATVVTMDADVEDLVTGDVLVQGGTILAVGADLGAAAADGRPSSST